MKFVLVLVALVVLASAAEKRYITLRKSPFMEVKIGAGTFNVVSYGAKGDGKTDDTKAIQSAIDAAGKAGGGTVQFPSPYVFLIKALTITGSHTNLQVDKGATVLVSNDRANWPGTADVITAGSSLTDISITGQGTFNGQGLIWWQNRDDFRPRFTYIHSKNVLIADVTFKDSPNHFLEMYSDNTEIARVTITAPASTGITNPSHNTDAVDVHGTPFYVHDCTFNTGDDNIASHSNHTLVENCHFGTGHGASVGSLCDVWLTNITFRNIIFNGTTCGARIKTKQGCTGHLSHVTYDKLTMTNVAETIQLTMFYDDPKSGTTLKIDYITYSSITSSNAGKPGEFTCDNNSPCRNIVMTNVNHSSTSGSWSCQAAHGTASNVTPSSCLAA